MRIITAFSALNLVRHLVVGDGWRRDREGSGEDGSDEGGEEEEEEGEVAASFE